MSKPVPSTTPACGSRSTSLPSCSVRVAPGAAATLDEAAALTPVAADAGSAEALAPESADEPQPVAATPIRAAAATETRIRFIGFLLVLRHIGLSDVITTIFIAACGAVRPAS